MQTAVAGCFTVFEAFGLGLSTLPLGCCGMTGTYGYEAEHSAMSEPSYGLSLAGQVARTASRAASSPISAGRGLSSSTAWICRPVSLLRTHLPTMISISVTGV